MNKQRREQLIRWCFEKMRNNGALREEMAEILPISQEKIDAMIEEGMKRPTINKQP